MGSLLVYTHLAQLQYTRRTHSKANSNECNQWTSLKRWNNHANSFVIVDKGEGKGLRICLDPQDLNTAIKREHYYTRTIDDIAPKLSGATHFSVLDVMSGYWMVPLDEESRL
jgi:hypothetical protein